jgi:hypothetical protein
MLGLPEGKVIRDTYLTTFGTMSDPSTRAKFQGLLTLATVRAYHTVSLICTGVSAICDHHTPGPLVCSAACIAVHCI